MACADEGRAELEEAAELEAADAGTAIAAAGTASCVGSSSHESKSSKLAATLVAPTAFLAPPRPPLRLAPRPPGFLPSVDVRAGEGRAAAVEAGAGVGVEAGAGAGATTAGAGATTRDGDEVSAVKKSSSSPLRERYRGCDESTLALEGREIAHERATHLGALLLALEPSTLEA